MSDPAVIPETIPPTPRAESRRKTTATRRRATSVDSGSLGLRQNAADLPLILKKKKEEPLLAANPGRFVIFPIANQQVWDMYKKAQASFWTAEELDLSKDRKDWEALPEKEQHFIKQMRIWRPTL